MRIYAERKMWGDGIALHANKDTREFKRTVALPLTFQAVDEGDFTEPFMTLPMTEAQSLMDALWHCGLRPSEGSGSAGALAATERHLADMRKLALHALKVKS